MLLVFMDVRGIIMVEYVPPYQMENQQFYIKILTKLLEDICEEDWICGVVGFCMMTLHFCTEQFWSVTLCWLGLVLFNIFPPRFKSSLKGNHFHSVEYILQELAEWLRALSQNDFRDCFEAWKAYMEQCVASNRNCMQIK